MLISVCFADDSCPIYKYNEAEQENCIVKNVSNERTTFNVHPCSYNKICDIKPEDTSKCESIPQINKKYPGEYCEDDDECFSKTCDKFEKKQCEGNTTGQICADDKDCHFGHYCSQTSKVCEVLKKEGESCSNSKCDFFLICNRGICVKIGYFPKFTAVDDSLACDTFYESGGICQDGPTYIQETGTSITNEPVICPANNQCKYTDGNQITCECGYREDQSKYCNPGLGDLKNLIPDVRA